jgi:hypothetical protein
MSNTSPVVNSNPASSIIPWKRAFPQIQTRFGFITEILTPIIREHMTGDKKEAVNDTVDLTITSTQVIVSGYAGITLIASYEYLAEHGKFMQVIDSKKINV